MAKRKYDYGLHAPLSNLWWAIHRGYNTLQGRFQNKLITFNENVIPANRIDKEALDRTAGHCQMMNTLTTAGAPRDRFAWESIAYANPSENIIIVIPEPVLPTGYKMDQNNSNRRYPVLRAIIPSRLCDLAASPEEVPEQERNDLSKFFIYDTINNMHRLPSTQMLSVFMAVPHYAIPAFITAFPCQHIVTYQNKQGRVITEECAIHVWCENCSNIAKALGAAWNPSTTSRHIAQLLATLASFCDFPNDIVPVVLEQETFKYDFGPHICSDKCYLNRTVL